MVGTCLRGLEQVVEQHHTGSLILLHGENFWFRGTTICILTQSLQFKTLQHNIRTKYNTHPHAFSPNERTTTTYNIHPHTFSTDEGTTTKYNTHHHTFSTDEGTTAIYNTYHHTFSLDEGTTTKYNTHSRILFS